jgi:hypothetical protein
MQSIEMIHIQVQVSGMIHPDQEADSLHSAHPVIPTGDDAFCCGISCTIEFKFAPDAKIICSSGPISKALWRSAAQRH